MEFKNETQLEEKFLIDNKIIEGVNPLTILKYDKEVYIDNKLNNYLKIIGFINSKFRLQKTLKDTKIELYNKLAFSAL